MTGMDTTTTETFPDSIEFDAVYRGTGFGDDEWQQNANLWNVVLRFEGRSFQTNYWMGVGLVDTLDRGGRVLKRPHEYRGPTKTRPRTPTRDEVLGSLASDCSLGQETFRDFCGDLGYDTDSRKALATWEACNNMVDSLRRLFGSSYEAFLERQWDT